MSTLRLAQAFTILWTPAAKQRPRTVVHDGKVRTYTPATTVDTEAMIRATLIQQGAFMYPQGVPVRLLAWFGVRRPKDAPRREEYPPRRPDLPNYLMLLADAGTGVLWADDAQVVQVECAKQVMDTPRVLVTVGVPMEHDVAPHLRMAWERWVVEREAFMAKVEAIS